MSDKLSSLAKSLEVRFRCQGCGQKYHFDASKFGRIVTCKRCSDAVIVPQVVLEDGEIVGHEPSLQRLKERGPKADSKPREVLADENEVLDERTALLPRDEDQEFETLQED